MASDAIRRVLAAITGDVARAVVDLGVEIHAEVTDATPVDTGFAANSWVLSIGAPSQRVAGAPGAVDPSVGAASVAETVRAYRIELGSVFVANNVAYLPRLNDGSSAQAPAGFIEAAIARAVENVRRRHA